MTAIVPCLLCVVAFAAAATRPHILYMVLDDVGYTDVSYHAGSDLKTPVIDALAKSGVTLEQMYVQPVCSPTRSSLLTGRYPFHTGMQQWDTLVPGSGANLPVSDPTVAELLRANGYRTSAIGKWHEGMTSFANTPTGRGFDSYVGYFQGQEDYYTHTIALQNQVGYDFWVNRTVDTRANGTYAYDLYMQEHTRVLQAFTGSAGPDSRLFMYFAHQLVHIPLQFPEDPKYKTACAHITDAKRNVYCAMMAALDDYTGLIVAQWKAAGLWDNTIMVVTTDNGGMVDFLESGQFPSSAGINFPLRAGKASLFEGGVRAVAFVTGGNNVFPQAARGTVDMNLWHASDFFPTLLGLAGVTVPAAAAKDSFDMWPAISKGATGNRTEIPLNINFQGLTYTALRSGDYKLIIGPLTGLYDGWWPVPPAARIPPPEHTGDTYLFNIKEDPNEHNDLHAQNRAMVAEMIIRLRRYMPDYVPPQANTEKCPLKNGVWAPCE